MKVLWLCNLVLPDFSQEFKMGKFIFGGWMTAMLHELEKREGIDISVCFPIYDESILKEGKCKGHDYYAFLGNRNAEIYSTELVETFERILKKTEPDIVHIWGTEYPHTMAMVLACKNSGLLDRCVIDIQGLVSVYSKHFLHGIPEECRTFKYGRFTSMEEDMTSFEKRGKYEIESIKMVRHVMGRTDWDRACVEAINADIQYHMCDRILRSSFYEYAGKWKYNECEKHSIFVSQASYPVKGFHYILQALPVIIKKYPDVHVYVTGPNIFIGEKNPYAVYLEALMEKLDIQTHISFLGMLNERVMIQKYLMSNVYVLASLIENESISLREAMILGVPCVASYVGGVYNNMSFGVEGFLYPHDEPALLAYYICKVFENKDDLCTKLSGNSVEKMMKIADSKRNADIMLQVYKEIDTQNVK